MKMTPSKLLNIVLVTVLVTSVFFMNTTATDEPQYDPWVDYDDDGIIGTSDLYYFGKAWYTSGDPTKNVNVTNFPLDEYGNLKVSLDGNQSGIYKDVAEITLLDWSSMVTYGGTFDIGVQIRNDVLRCLLPFHFFPKGQLINVTDFWIVFTHATSPSMTAKFDITVNSNSTWTSHHYGAFADYWTLAITTEHVEDVSVYQLIRPGINTLEFRNVQGTWHSVWFYRITVFIEYEYQA